MPESDDFVQVGVDREFIEACSQGAAALILKAEQLATAVTLYPRDQEKISTYRKQARQLDDFVKAARLHFLTH